MAVTLNLNQFQTEVISLDAGSESWLKVVHEKGKKQRSCAIPKQYFDVLKTRGLVDGAPGNTTITARGNSYFLTEEMKAKTEKKSKKK
jgi:hypothetical protein